MLIGGGGGSFYSNFPGVAHLSRLHREAWFQARRPSDTAVAGYEMRTSVWSRGALVSPLAETEKEALLALCVHRQVLYNVSMWRVVGLCLKNPELNSKNISFLYYSFVTASTLSWPSTARGVASSCELSTTAGRSVRFVIQV